MSAATELALARLKTEEGKRARAYNDATGATVTCQPGGNLSIGYGINLETGLDNIEMDFLLNHRLSLVEANLSAQGWYANSPVGVQSVLLDIGYNAGVAGLLTYHRMLTALQSRDWGTAADELLNSSAARQLPQRYQALAAILRSGQ